MIDGTASVVHLLSRTLADEGHDVTVYTTDFMEYDYQSLSRVEKVLAWITQPFYIVYVVVGFMVLAVWFNWGD